MIQNSLILVILKIWLVCNLSVKVGKWLESLLMSFWNKSEFIVYPLISIISYFPIYVMVAGDNSNL